MGTYTIRDVNEKTKGLIQHYAREHDVNIAEALQELVQLAFQHIRHTKKEKKYASFSDIYQRVRFKGGKVLSKEHDKVAYGL